MDYIFFFFVKHYEIICKTDLLKVGNIQDRLRIVGGTFLALPKSVQVPYLQKYYQIVKQSATRFFLNSQKGSDCPNLKHGHEQN